MADAKRDNNYISTLIALDSSDGVSVVLLNCNGITGHGLHISDGTSGDDKGGDHAIRDNNNIPVMLAVSSDDGVTPVAIYADASTNSILIKST